MVNAESKFLSGKRVLITGAGSGIGKACVIAFLEAGADVLAVDSNAQSLSELESQFKVKTMVVALSKPDEHFPDPLEIDILINNAANDTRHKIDDVTEEYWNERINVNLRHFFFTVQSVKKSMIDNGGGAIINMGSTSWMVGQGGMAAYTAEKSGVVGLSRSFARDLGEFNIRVNSVVPGWVMTQRQIDLWLNDESEKELMKRQCLKEKLMPHELAQAVLFFSSEQSSGCTNQSYVVDKGWL